MLGSAFSVRSSGLLGSRGSKFNGRHGEHGTLNIEHRTLNHEPRTPQRRTTNPERVSAPFSGVEALDDSRSLYDRRPHPRSRRLDAPEDRSSPRSMPIHRGTRVLPFGRLPMVHFASFVVFSDPVQEAGTPPLLDHLVFESCIDGPVNDYIEALLHLGLQTLHELFSCCRGYNARVPSYDDVRDYIVDRRRKPHLLHIGSPGLRVDHIKAGDSLRRVLDRELDDVVKRGRSTDRPLDLMRALRASLNVPPSTRDHWFLREADSHGDRATTLRLVCRSAVPPRLAAVALGKAHRTRAER